MELPDYPFAPNWLDLDGLRMHYVDEGEGKPVLLLHGEPTWSFLWRHVIPPVVASGRRAVARRAGSPARPSHRPLLLRVHGNRPGPELIAGARHFLQEDAPDEVAAAIVRTLG